jgi:zinc D-Ala-D-Ala carboxypeptidase
MQISEHFSLKEMTESYTATRLKIDNSPPNDVIENLKLLCQNVLEPIRKHFGKPVKINSAYRCPALNKAVGGASNSQHVVGSAADIEVPGVANEELAKWIEKNLTFDQLIREFMKPNDPTAGWVHVSFSKARNRKQSIKIG